MAFYLEFILGMLLLSPLFVWIYFIRKDGNDHLCFTLKMHRDRQHAIKGDYHKIDPDN
ncbi:hypothetical protein GCM10007989_13220 [Devosia pacifica]|uniref:Uncharacterized protein n=1 Tax=Devosia pacifica TaxID=1335967 RepID=A0A918S082_9HYPH|nr:hypothetical protein GCM10007989_13220 [Devosia pacifica]